MVEIFIRDRTSREKRPLDSLNLYVSPSKRNKSVDTRRTWVEFNIWGF
jgi:hypothetical protein